MEAVSVQRKDHQECDGRFRSSTPLGPWAMCGEASRQHPWQMDNRDALLHTSVRPACSPGTALHVSVHPHPVEYAGPCGPHVGDLGLYPKQWQAGQ